MKKVLLVAAIVSLLFAGVAGAADETAETTVLFDFENGLQGWDIPDWAYEKPDHVQESIAVSDKFSSEGANSLQMDVSFPGGKWTGGIVEIMQFFDWSDYGKIACDVYLPLDGPEGLKAQMILTVGDKWKWVEMSRSYELIPGEWVSLIGDLKPGSIDWRRVQVDEGFRQDIRKIDIRVFSNNKPAYTGPIYIDNVRIEK